MDLDDPRIFWVNDYEFELEIPKLQMSHQTRKKILCRWLRVWTQTPEIQNKRSKLVTKMQSRRAEFKNFDETWYSGG